MESERRLNEKYLSEGGDISRTVLLDVLTHRFSFLKSLSSCTRNKLYWAVFQREVTALSKISINEYLKFSEIFIGRDADPTALSSFIYLFLFGHQPPQVEKVTMIIAKLKGPSSKLKEVSERLVAIFEAILLNEIYSDENSNKTLDNLSPQIIISLIKKDELLIEWFIDLIIDK